MLADFATEYTELLPPSQAKKRNDGALGKMTTEKPPFPSTFARRLHARRKELNWTLEVLGRQVGGFMDPEGTAFKWEKVGQEPDYVTLVRLARVIGVRVGWLLGEEGTPAPMLPAIRPARAKRLTDAALEIVSLLRDLTPPDEPHEPPDVAPVPPAHSSRPGVPEGRRGPRRGRD